MMIGGIYTGRNEIRISKPNGRVTSVRYSNKNQKKKKRLNYNFKTVSSQILLSKTSNVAGKAVTKARGVIAGLLRKVGSGDYDDQDLRHAIIHARKMERIAKKRVKHLKQEEEIEQKGKTDELENELLEGMEEQAEEEQELELSEEELQEMLEEYEELMQEMMQESMEEILREADLAELSEEFSGAVYEMEPEDLEQLKKKHRTDEMREIMDADMKYLRAMFNKLEKERQALSEGVKSLADTPAAGGVSLEFSGMDIPVDTPPVPEVVQGTKIDTML